MSGVSIPGLDVWPTEPLGSLCDVVIGRTPSRNRPDFWGGDLPWLSIADMNQGRSIRTTKERITSLGAKESKSRFIPPGTVLLSFKLSIGKVAVTDIDTYTNEAIAALPILNPMKLSRDFLFWSLRSIRLDEEVDVAAKGKTLNKAKLERLEIPLPPLAEQKRIAAVLDKADALRRQRQESLQLTDKLIQSIFLDMFGDPVTNPMRWPVESLTKACQLSSGGTPSKSNPTFWDGNLPWYTPKDLKKDELADSIDHVSESVLTETNLKLYPEGTVLIVVRGMILSHSFPVSIIKKAGIVNQDIKAISPIADVHPQFLAACLRAQRSLILTKVTTAGHGTKKLDAESLSEIQIFLPPKDLQLKFVELVNRHRELFQDGESSKDCILSLFSSIQQRAFRGELDLSRLNLDEDAETPPESPVSEPAATEGRYKRPGCFIAPPNIEAQMMELEDKLDSGPGDSIPWSEDYFKYRTLSQILRAPFNFSEIWEAVYYDMADAQYEDVKDKVFEYVSEGILSQQFDEEEKEIVFYPQP